MQITWEVEDGYVGKSRPQHTEIDDDHLKECDTIEEMLEVVEDYIQADFEDFIGWDMNWDRVESMLQSLIKDGHE